MNLKSKRRNTEILRILTSARRLGRNKNHITLLFFLFWSAVRIYQLHRKMCFHWFNCHLYAILGEQSGAMRGSLPYPDYMGVSTLPFWRLKSKEALFLTKQREVRNKVSLRFNTTKVVMRFRIISNYAICACVNIVHSFARISMGSFWADKHTVNLFTNVHKCSQTCSQMNHRRISKIWDHVHKWITEEIIKRRYDVHKWITEEIIKRQMRQMCTTQTWDRRQARSHNP